MTREWVELTETGLQPRVVTVASTGEGEQDRRLFLDPLTHTMTPVAKDLGAGMQIVAGTDAEAQRVKCMLEGAPNRPVTIPMTRNPTISARNVSTERRIRVTVVGVPMTGSPTRSLKMTMHRSDTTGRSI